MLMRQIGLYWGVAFLAALSEAALGQVPIPGYDADPPSTLNAAVRSRLERTAGRYPFVGIKRYGADSTLLVFADSTLAAAPLRAGTWMFGPAAKAGELDGCPPEKVLGRKIARTYFDAVGRPSELRHVLVLVRGTKDLDRWTAMGMHYYGPQLAGKWAGDSLP